MNMAYAIPEFKPLVKLPPIGATKRHTSGTGSVNNMIRGDDWVPCVQLRTGGTITKSDIIAEISHPTDLRTVAQHIENIRKIFNPSITEIASMYGVTRQAFYKWIHGTSTPDPDKTKRIRELSRMADKFAEAGITRTEYLLKIKTFQGQSLMDLLKAGECSDKHVDILIQEARALDANYQKSGIASSKTKPSDEWKSYMSIPGTLGITRQGE